MMISNNVISLFLLAHDHIVGCKRNLCSIQDLMRSYKPDGTKFKRVCTDIPNLALLNKNNNLVEMRPFRRSSLGRLSPPFTLKDPLNIWKWCPSMPNMHLPDTVKSTAWSRRSSFAPPSVNFFYQRICRTRRLWTLSSSLHSLPRRLYYMDIHKWQVLSIYLIPRYCSAYQKPPPIHRKARGEKIWERTMIWQARQKAGKMQRTKIRITLQVIAATSRLSSKPSQWRQPVWRPPYCLCMRTIAWPTGSGDGLNTISSPLQPLSLSRHNVTWYHGTLDQQYDATSKCRILLSRHCGTSQSFQRKKGTRLPPSNVPRFHPGINRIVWPQHSVGPSKVNLPLPECAQHNCATSRLCADVRMAQSLPSNVLLPIPPPGPYIRYPRPRWSHRDVPPTDPSIIGRPRGRTEKCDTGRVPPGNGTGPNIQGRDWRVVGSTVTHGNHYKVAPTRHKELCASGCVLIGWWWAPHMGHGYMASTNWPLQAKIWQGVCGKPFFGANIAKCIHNWVQVFLHPQNMTCLDNL